MKCPDCGEDKYVLHIRGNHKYICDDCKKEEEKKKGKKYKKEVHREDSYIK